MKSEQELVPYEIGLVLKRLQDKNALSLSGEPAIYEIEENPQNTYPSVQNQIAILAHLVNLEAIRLVRRGYSETGNAMLEDVPSKSGDQKAKGIFFERVNPTFDALYGEYSKYKAPTIPRSSAEYWITENNGEYWYKSVRIHFKNPNAKYVKIFAAVFSAMPYGGEESYKKIITKHKGYTNKKKIQRALTGKGASFFEYIHQVDREPKIGVPLFEPGSTKMKLRFNNQKSDLHM